MLKFFQYNWQVRDEWFKWCNSAPNEELLKERIGGVNSILFTLFHIVDVEYSWLRIINGKKDITYNYEEFSNLDDLYNLSNGLREEVNLLLKHAISLEKDKLVTAPWIEQAYTVDDILHHVIVHEIHHTGQLSIWAREIEHAPVHANVIGRDLKV